MGVVAGPALCAGGDVAAEMVHGLHAVQALLEERPEQVLELWLLAGREDAGSGRIRRLAERAGISVQSASRKTLARLAEGARHQGVVARARVDGGARIDLETFVEGLGDRELLLALDGVQDPRNLGAILRSANAAGVAAVVLSPNRSVGLTAVARKAASGAAERTPLISVSNLVQAIKFLKNEGFMAIGANGSSTHSLYQTDLGGRIVFVMGGEGEGLRRLTRDTCDQLVGIPMQGTVESLNVSVAAAICLFEARRQGG